MHYILNVITVMAALFGVPATITFIRCYRNYCENYRQLPDSSKKHSAGCVVFVCFVFAAICWSVVVARLF